MLRLATVRRGGVEVAAVVLPDGGATPLDALPDGPRLEPWPSDLPSLLEAGVLEELRALYAEDPAAFEDGAIVAERVAYAPLYRRPRKIWGIGLNYAEHAGDLGEKAPSEEPASFMRPDTTIVGPGDPIKLPQGVGRVTAEAELGVVIGRVTKDVSEEEAPLAVAGFTAVLDMTAEDILRKNPRYLTRAKSFDTFFSFGPHLLTPDEVGELENLQVATVLNGEVRRENTVSNMTFSPYELVAFHSLVMTLLPGDVISTGTPGAVEITDGDVAECRISGFEALVNPVTL